LLARHAFAIERRTELQRMVSVIADGDVFAKQLFAHALVEAGTLVLERGGGKVVKEKANEIEHGSGFKNDGVAAGREFARVNRHVCFLASTQSELLWIKIADARSVCLGPACGGSFLHGDGEFGVRFVVGSKKSAGIAHRGLLQAAGENSGSHLAV